MPSPDVREAANLLLKVSESRNASLSWGNAGVTIRFTHGVPSPQTPVSCPGCRCLTVYPPGVPAEYRTIRELLLTTVRATGLAQDPALNFRPESLPTNLREVLENWAAHTPHLFADGQQEGAAYNIFVHRRLYPSPGWQGVGDSVSKTPPRISGRHARQSIGQSVE